MIEHMLPGLGLYYCTDPASASHNGKDYDLDDLYDLDHDLSVRGMDYYTTLSRNIITFLILIFDKNVHYNSEQSCKSLSRGSP